MLINLMTEQNETRLLLESVSDLGKNTLGLSVNSNNVRSLLQIDPVCLNWRKTPASKQQEMHLRKESYLYLQYRFSG